MASFLRYQQEARKRTRFLVLLYGLCLVGLVASFLALTTVILHFWNRYIRIYGPDRCLQAHEEPLSFGALQRIAESNSDVLGIVALVVLGIVGIATLVKVRQLRSGGPKVARELGGRRIKAGTKDRLEKRLLNIVEEMAIASGVAIPAVYVLDGERTINAFAAGYSPDDAAVTVTRGALENLNREELQSVIGHEFSHILNGDMRLNIRLLSTVFGIVCIAIFGKIVIRLGADMCRGRSRSQKGNPGPIIALVGVFIWLLGSIGVFFGKLIQATISRQREFLADASSVQFTRNPLGMTGALKTIGAIAGHGTLNTPRAGEISHMLFAEGSISRLFASHPELDARIRRFEPGFKGDYSEAKQALRARAKARAVAAAAEENGEDAAILGSLAAFAAREGQKAPATTPADPTLLLDDSLRDPEEAPSILCGALLSDDDGVRAAQVRTIATTLEEGPERAKRALDWKERFRTRPLRDRRAACEIAITALRDLDSEDRRGFGALLGQLIQADGIVEPFEFTLRAMFRNRMYPMGRPSHEANPRSAAHDAYGVLAALAHFGSTDARERQTAFAAGASALAETFGPAKGDAAFLTEHVALCDFDLALMRLRTLPPNAKAVLLDGAHRTIAADGSITADEEALYLAVADVLDGSALAV